VSRSRLARGLLAVAALLAPAAALAQDSAAAPATPGTVFPGALVRAPFSVDGRRLRAGVRRYQVLLTTDSGARPVGTRDMLVGDAVHAGRPAWQVVDRRVTLPPLIRMSATDSVVIDRATLVPFRWEAEAGGGRLAATFANDSIYAGTSSETSRRTFVVPAAPQMVTSEAALDVMLGAAALGLGWVADATMLVIDHARVTPVALRLVVEREERIEVPAGAFDVWMVSARAGGAERWLWVDKRSGVVVRAAESPPHMAGTIVERVLVAP